MKRYLTTLSLTAAIASLANPALAAELPASANLRSALVLHASFDKTADADVAKGDAHAYTVESSERKTYSPGIQAAHIGLSKQGKYGGALEYKSQAPEALAYKGKSNTGYKAGPFDMTVSFWMSMAPEKAPGYNDPIQIGDSKWDDAAIWVDFPKDPATQRHFRLAAVSDVEFGNPAKTPFTQLPASEQPMITTQAPFAAGQWNHIAIVVDGANKAGQIGSAKLYVDGKLQGDIKRELRFTWDEDKLAIMVGWKYVGLIDDLAVFDKALSQGAVDKIRTLDGGIAKLK